MKPLVATTITVLALLGSACSTQGADPAPTGSTSSHVDGGLTRVPPKGAVVERGDWSTPEKREKSEGNCSARAAQAPAKYAQYKGVVLDAIRAGVPAPETNSAYRSIPTDQPWSSAFVALLNEDTCTVDGLSTAWGVNVQAWLYSKEK
ncbi:hypothetical protein BKG74_18315 [Mycobacteroides chelonae]|uniref:hypothetical protein n=1 Tax=Mycobacteroides TaxID=670516 RepID=UPI0008A89B7E|nr:hypothetical protein [Mycobacteroides chelonae]MBE5506453.1 hypothetical protein [Mycobacteroides abscessus]MBV6362763.1 hypothetical protein [Mycobacteroides chelonae]OHU18448.1 hypothetical protein BKG74_18315 [Mycobacteroides chelonae]